MKEYKYKINGNLYNVVIGDMEENIVHVEVNGTHYTVETEKKMKAAPAPKPVVRPAAKPAAAPAAAAPAAKPAAGKSGVKSPLPGVILDIKVKEGDEVKKGQTITVLVSIDAVFHLHGFEDDNSLSLLHFITFLHLDVENNTWQW